MSFDYLSAFFIGLLGSGHCIAMCGGVAGMLTSVTFPLKKDTSPNAEANSTDRSVTLHAVDNKDKNINKNDIIPTKTVPIPQQTVSAPAKYSLVVYYNIGRIFSYALLGGIVGFTGSIAAKNIGVPIAGLRIVAAIFLIFLGLYIGQWLMWLNRIESVGKSLWSKISPLAKYVIPVNTKTKAFGLGSLWGWLPCGLVYSTLTWSMASGGFIEGGTIMLFFGMGTLPALFAVSFGFTFIASLVNKPIFKKIMAISLIIYGIYSFFFAYGLIF